MSTELVAEALRARHGPAYAAPLAARPTSACSTHPPELLPTP